MKTQVISDLELDQYSISDGEKTPRRMNFEPAKDG
jgi:hypothetical protein